MAESDDVKNRCPDNELIVRYARGDLAPDSERTMREHLTACVRCRKLVRGWLDLQNALELESSQLESDDFVKSVTGGLPRSAGRIESGISSWLPQAAGLALAVLILCLPGPQQNAGDVTALLMADQPEVDSPFDVRIISDSGSGGGIYEY
jgi:anti-sigma factor RsiW